MWAYESALRDECGYTGAQPVSITCGNNTMDQKLMRKQYWNWFTNANDIYKSPVFDGSDTSMSGDGDYFEHNGALGGASLIKIPSGNGGGCVSSGPFAK